MKSLHFPFVVCIVMAAVYITGCHKATEKLYDTEPLNTSTTSKDITVEKSFTIPKGTILHEFPGSILLELPDDYIISGISTADQTSQSSAAEPGGPGSGIKITCVCKAGTGQCTPFTNSEYAGCITKVDNPCTLCEMKISIVTRTVMGILQEVEIHHPTIYNYKEEPEIITDRRQIQATPFITTAMLDNPVVMQQLASVMKAYNTKAEANELKGVPIDKIPAAYSLQAVKIMGHLALVPVPSAKTISLVPEENNYGAASCSCSNGSGTCVKKSRWVPVAGTVYWCEGNCNGCTLTVN